MPHPKHDINFLELMQSFRRGELLRAADDELEKVMAAMVDTGGDGSITIKIPLKFNKAGQVEVTPSITSKLPQKAMGTGIYFADDDGHLSRRDPSQMDIEDEIERRRFGGGEN